MFVTKKKFLETTANLSAEVSFHKDRIYRQERWYSEAAELAARRVRELREELADARDELAGTEDELADARADLEDTEVDLADAIAELEGMEKKLADARVTLAYSEEELANVRAELSDSEDSAAYYLRECMALRDRLNGQP